MKKFQKLEISARSGREQELVDLLNALKTKKSSAFAYMKLKSDDYAINIFLEKDHAACFKTQRKTLFESCVWVYIMYGKLTVANITSEKNPSLGIVNYNLVLDAFLHDFLQSELNNNNFIVETTGENVSMEQMLCAETYRKLSAWEGLCNKENPISHAFDRERWFAFLVSLVENEDEITASDLEQWLQEDKHWPTFYNDKVSELADKFEYGVDLLKHERGLE